MENKALEYQRIGINIVPQTRDKKTRVGWKNWQTEKQTENDVWGVIQKFKRGTRRPMNIAAIAGKISGIVVVDLDNKAAVEWAKSLDLPETPLAKTGKGFHIYYRYPKNRTIPIIQKVLGEDKSGPIVDIVSDYHLITLPPSIHQSGKEYTWIPGRSIFDIGLAELPIEIIEIIDNYTRNKEELKYNTTAKSDTRRQQYPASTEIKEKVSIMALLGKFSVSVIDKEVFADHFKIRCPFPGHEDKTPSFAVYETTDSYHCFGCNRSGDIFSFTQEWNQCSFSEACSWINREFGLIELRACFSEIKEITPIVSGEVFGDIAQAGAVICGMIKPVDVHDSYEKLTGTTKKKLTFAEKITVTTTALAEIFKTAPYKIIEKEGQLYLYNGAFWMTGGEGFFQRLLTGIAVRSGLDYVECRHYVNAERVYKQGLFELGAQGDSIRGVSARDDGIVAINLKNGTVLFQDGKFSVAQFDFRDFFEYQLSFDYNPDAECPMFFKFLNRVLPDLDSQASLQEFAGYLFTKNSTLKLEKLLVLLGSGSNGKSVFHDILSSLLGTRNGIGLSLSDLHQEHYRAMLSGKLLCYGSEMGKSSDQDLLKKLASGEPIAARHKYGKSFVLTDYCRFIFNTNELPGKIEHVEAFFRRFLIIPFKIQISDAEKDQNLAIKIIKNELPGVFNWVLAGLVRLMKNKSFTVSRESRTVLHEFRTEQDSVKMFLADFLLTSEAEEKIKFPLGGAYSRYKDYCNDNGFRPLGKRNFSIRVEREGFKKTRDNVGINFEKDLPF